MGGTRLSQVLLGAGIGLVALIAAGLGADWLVEGRLGFGAATPDALAPTPVAVTIAGEKLRIPANVIRFATERHTGALKRIDLAFRLPDLEGRTSATAADFLTPARDGRLVFVSIAPAGEALDTAAMLATVYQRYLDPTEAPGPAGLTRRAFRIGTPYAGEELYFEPGSAHPFAARCYAEKTGEPPLTCMRDIRFGTSLMATLRFPRKELDGWTSLASRLEALLAGYMQSP